MSLRSQMSTFVVLISLAASSAAAAAVIDVTRLDDVIGGPGVSLRDAIDLANSDGEDSTIVLANGGVYVLSIDLPADDANLGGDLDHTEPFTLTIEGNGATIQQQTVDRVLHNHTAGSTVILNDVAIENGEVGLGFSGGAVRMPEGHLECHGTTFTNNESGESGGAIDVRNGNLTVTESSFVANDGLADGGAIFFFAPNHTLVVSDSEFEENFADFGSVIRAKAASVLTVARCSATNNFGYHGSTLAIGAVDRGTIVDCSFEANDSDDTVLEYVDLRPPTLRSAPIVIRRSTIAGSAAWSAALFINTNSRALRLENSTVAYNDCVGVRVAFDGIFDSVHSTIVKNETFNVQSDASSEVSLFATVVAEVGGEGFDCSRSVVSRGYNFDGDGSCGLGAGTRDRSAGGDPELAPLANNGGPTRTCAPYWGSPLTEVVPIASSADELGRVPTDQRGTPRPNGFLCEVGAYEGKLLTPEPKFVARGDVDGDGWSTYRDAIVLLRALETSSSELTCLDAADANDDGLVNRADVLFISQRTFLRDLASTQVICDQDRTPDRLGCAEPSCSGIVSRDAVLVIGLEK